MKNKFFETAIQAGSRMLGKPGRLLNVAVQLAPYLISAKKNLSKQKLGDQIGIFGKIIRAYATGKYRAISSKSFLAILGAAIYFLNPIDLIPDALAGIGFLDDFAVLSWVYNALRKDIDRFKDWEAQVITGATRLSRRLPG